MAKVVFTLCLDSERDRDVVRWLDHQENKSGAVRDAIRAQMGASLADVYAVVCDVRRLLTSGGVVVRAGGDDPDDAGDPLVAEVEAQLDGLGL